MKKSIAIFVVSCLILIACLVVVSSLNPKKEKIITPVYNIELNGEKNIVLEYGEEFNDPGYTVYDSNGKNVDVVVDVKNNVKSNVPGTYEITYSINGQVVVTRKIVVKEKKIQPKNLSDKVTFELVGDEKLYVLKDTEFVDPKYIVKSKSTGEDLSKYAYVVGGVDTTREGIYDIKYRFVYDGDDLELSRKVFVVYKDVTFKLNGDSRIELEYGSSFTDPSFVATSNGQDLTSKVVVDGKVDGNVPGTYVITYTLNTNDFVAVLTRTVVVKEKDVVIDFHLNGDETINITVGDTFVDPFVVAVGDNDVDYSSKVVVTGKVDTNTPGKYEITYQLKVDKIDKTLVRYVVVNDKPLEIEFTLKGSSKVSIYVGQTFKDDFVTAKGSDGVDYSDYVTKTGSVNTSVAGTYTIKYNLVYGNINKTLKRTVIVNKKEIKVNFNLIGNETVNIKLNGSYVDPGYKAVDSDGKNLNSYVKVSGSVNTSKTGTYEIKYTLKYEDYSKTLVRKVNVKGNNYTISTSKSATGVTITIKSNLNNFGHYVTPDLRSVTTSKLVYNVSKNGKYTFYMFDSNNTRTDTIIVNVNTIDTTKPTASCTASVSNKSVTYNVTASDAGGIAKYVHNGKTYTTNKFTVSGQVENDVVRVYDKAGNYIDTTCVYSPISSGNKKVIASYSSDTLKYWIEKPGTYYTVTHIWVKDAANQLNVAVNTKMGSLETTQTIVNNTISKYGYSKKGMVAANGSGFIMSSGDSFENYVSAWRLSSRAPVIFVRGSIVRDFTNYSLPGTYPVYAMKSNGYMTYYSFGSGKSAIEKNKKVVQKMKSDGVRSTVSFNPVLVKDYKAQSSSTDANIRQAICQIDRNNFVIITNTNGTGNRGVGFNFKDLASYMVSLNCRSGYNLDGGGSTNLFYKKNNSTLSSIVSTSRKVADILYFVEQ